ncbi:MAG: hypothetical protein PHD21_03865 [Flavobacteriales bacterium]|nr:hypothetical protein [Flavobacteriales bacterium]
MNAPEYRKGNFFIRQRPEKSLFDLPKKEQEKEKAVFSHLSSELSIYGVNEPLYVEKAIENALRVLVNSHVDSQNHFQNLWIGGAEGVERLWEISDIGWKLTLVCAAHRSSELSDMLLRNLKHFK